MRFVLPGIAAVVSAIAAIIWIRAAVRQDRVVKRLAAENIDPDLWRLANNDYRRDIQMAIFTVLAAVACAAVAIAGIDLLPAVLVSALALPSAVTLLYSGSQSEIARLAEARVEVEQRAREVLSQEELAPLQWAARLAPSKFEEFEGLEIGQAYEASSGAMSGDFYDVFEIDGDRVAAVIGDVTGHGLSLIHI